MSAALESPVWNGLPLSLPDLCALTGISRTTLWRDMRIGLLKRPPRQAGVRGFIFPAPTVDAYLRRKFPHLLPPGG